MDWLNFIFKIIIPIVVGISVSLQFKEWCYQKAIDDKKEEQRKKDDQLLKELKEILKKEKTNEKKHF